MKRHFMEMLQAKWAERKFVCVGLDSEFGKIPSSAWKSGIERDVDVANTIVAFNREIVEATKDLVCAYKPNIAFYEAHGSEGVTALHRTIVDIHIIAPDVPVILDAKRADIGNTNHGYVKMAFEYLGADAITVHPYLGAEALKPFLDREEKGIIVLCKTSNSGSGEFQDLPVPVSGYFGKKSITTRAYVPLYQYVAHQVATKWNKNGNCALVVGATYPKELATVREIVDDIPILIPGIGTQGGDVEKTVKAGVNSKGTGMIINSSSGIIFASKGEDFARVAGSKTLELHGSILNFLPQS